MKKRLILMLCVISCLMMVTGCSLTRVNPKLDEKTLTDTTKESAQAWFDCNYSVLISTFGDLSEDELKTILSQTNYADIARMYGGMSDEELTQSLSAYNYDEATIQQLKETMIEPAVAIAPLIEQYDDDYAAIARAIDDSQVYVDLQKEHGAMVEMTDTDYSLAADSASVSVTISTEKSDPLVYTATYDKNGKVSDWKVEEYQTIGQIMGRAGLNTVMAMGIVFCVLIFIALLISCFKFINQVQAKQSAPEPAAAPVVEVPVVQEDLTDDLELVAVITAAIAAASENECTDGLMVRSIIRRS